MSKFSVAVKKVLAHEGGYVNHPNDRGGETNWGITRKTYENYIGKTAGPDEIRNMPKGNAVKIYKKNYWDAVRGDDIQSYSIAFSLFDQGVNRGPSRAISQAQEVLGIYPDGSISNEMVKRLNNADEKEFIKKYLARSERAYRNIVASNPSQQVFLNGWLKRVTSLRNYTSIHFGKTNPIDWMNVSLWTAAFLGLGGAGYYGYTTLSNAEDAYAYNPRVSLKNIKTRK